MNIFLKFQGETVIVQEQQLYYILLNNQSNDQGFIFVREGKILNSCQRLLNDQTVWVFGKQIGGKGGFGAKLKTEGGKKVRPNENMFSRDLQGQPISYATITRQYQQYYTKRLQEDKKVSKQLADFKVVSNTYKQDYVSNKLDSTYNAEIIQNQNRLKDAMKVGMKKFLQKKKQQLQMRPKEQIPQQDQIKESEKEEDNKEVAQQCPKRSRPSADQQQKQKSLTKRVKLNNQSGQVGQKIQNKLKSSSQEKKPQQQKISNYRKTMSAAEKLKSLFKK